MTNPFDLIVFDWDGTLMDSEAQIVDSIHAAMSDLCLERLPDEQVRNIIGLGLKESIDALVPGRDDRFHQQFVDRYRYHWFAADGSSLFPGVEKTLERLAATGYFLGVATGKGRRGLDRVLKDTGLDLYFHATRCSDETQSKPHPQMLQEIMTDLDVAPYRTLMVGDTEWDLEMGRQAGTATVAVSYGAHELDRLRALEPLAIIHDISRLPELLGQLSVSKFVQSTD